MRAGDEQTGRGNLARGVERGQVAGETAHDPVGAEKSVTSCDLHVLTDETSEPVASQRSDDGSGGRWGAARGWALIQRSVWTVGVEVLDVLA